MLPHIERHRLAEGVTLNRPPEIWQAALLLTDLTKEHHHETDLGSEPDYERTRQ